MSGEVGNRGEELRQRAEARLEELPADREVMNPQALQSLVHELRVHQIELEMQNEELRRAQEELAASRDRYVDLYDFAPVDYLTVGERGAVQQANLTAATLLGVERGKLQGQPFSRFVVAEDQDIFYRHRRAVQPSLERPICQLRMRRENGTVFWAELESRRLAGSGDGSGAWRTVLTDITPRRQAEEALRQARDELEQRVAERTAQLQQENAQRRQAELRFRTFAPGRSPVGRRADDRVEAGRRRPAPGGF